MYFEGVPRRNASSVWLAASGNPECEQNQTGRLQQEPHPPRYTLPDAEDATPEELKARMEQQRQEKLAQG